mgnify:CR=1 FL=1
MTDEGLHRLTCAIIARAVYDYHSALKGHCVNGYRNCEDVKDDCERFFRSSWLHRLAPELDGEWIIECTKKNVEAWKKKNHKSKSRVKNGKVIKTFNGSRKEYSSTLYAAYYDGKRSRVGTANELAKELGLTTNAIRKRVSRAMEGCKSAFDPVIVPTNTKYDTEEYVRSILKQGERKKPRANRPPNTQYHLIDCHTQEEIMVGTAKELAEYENVTVTAIKLRIRQKFKYNKWKPRVNFVEEIE